MIFSAFFSLFAFFWPGNRLHPQHTHTSPDLPLPHIHNMGSIGERKWLVNIFIAVGIHIPGIRTKPQKKKVTDGAFKHDVRKRISSQGAHYP